MKENSEKELTLIDYLPEGFISELFGEKTKGEQNEISGLDIIVGTYGYGCM